MNSAHEAAHVAELTEREERTRNAATMNGARQILAAVPPDLRSRKGEKLPFGNAWKYDKARTYMLWGRTREQLGEGSLSVWRSMSVFVISGLELAKAPDGRGDVIWQWHMSISHRGDRPTELEVKRALGAFGMVGAEEDNHHPGGARHFWRPVDPSRRVDCECKEDEAIVVEPDGYRWSKSRAPDASCEYCEMIAIGRTDVVCPVHG